MIIIDIIGVLYAVILFKTAEMSYRMTYICHVNFSIVLRTADFGKVIVNYELECFCRLWIDYDVITQNPAMFIDIIQPIDGHPIL